jgi:Leucine-rich repeat (LRR) protein
MHSLPNSLQVLTNLQSLNLAGNDIEAIPDWCCDMTHIRFLSLARNMIFNTGQRMYGSRALYH